MGTSKGYGMPTGGDWTPLKNEANKFIKGDGEKDEQNNPVPVSPARLIGRYIRALGGADDISFNGESSTSGGRSGGSGGRVGRAASSTGTRLGGFLSGVGVRGLAETLREIGLAHLIGKSAKEVSTGLLDAFTAPGSTLDQYAVREALSQLYDEMLDGTETFEDVEAALTKTISDQGISKILADFFCKYLFALFCRDFYEGWLKKVGAAQAGNSLKDIKDFFSSELEVKFVGQDTSNVDWSGQPGLSITRQIMKKTLEIFEVVQ